MPTPFQTGLDRCLAEPPAILARSRFGLVMNQASVDSGLRYSCDALADRFPNRLAALFSPQHGLWCEQQDNMIETPHGVYEPLGIPVYSLYSETRTPAGEMLADLDCLVIDLQDVGTRVYTFAWTMVHCLQACAAAKIPVVVLDRPNPLGGLIVEGPRLKAAFRSFVGLAEIPMRHGLTLGELALLVNRDLRINAELEIVPMNGWRRDMLWPDTGRAWIPPSPNMPRFETALVYPGQVLLEGTNLSEGRGTTIPFEIAGAPFVSQHRLHAELARLDLPGLHPTPVRFRPTFNKWHDQSCGGIYFLVTDRHAARSYTATVALMATVHMLWPDQFQLIPPPYEYETEKLPLDILTGSDLLSRRLRTGPLDAADVAELCVADHGDWEEASIAARLYS